MHRICHISSVHPRYDIRIFVKECLSLLTNGYEVSLVVADDLVSEELKDGISIYSVGKPQNRYERLRKTAYQIYQKVLEIRPDVVHFHDPELMIIGKKLSKRGFIVIYDVHEDLPKQILNKHWLPSLIRPFVSYMITMLEKYYARYYAGIITATEIIASRFIQYNKNSISICNYPKLSELNSSYSSWTNRQNVICYIGSISSTRGIEPLVQSLALSKFRLQLAGIFSGDLSLNDLEKLPGGSYIDYLGVLDRTAIKELLGRVKVGVVTLLPTPSYVESLPIKMFEYMLAGIPVVASDFPLWREIILKYNCGILVNPEDIRQIAQSCQKLLSDQDMAYKMGENGRLAVLEYFNWESEGSKLLKFYKRLF